MPQKNNLKIYSNDEASRVHHAARQYRGRVAARGARAARGTGLLFAEQDRAVIRPCLQELQRLGYVDGKSVAIDYRDAEGNYERLPELAAELVRLNPDMIYSFGGEQAPILKRATASIPIVVWK